MADLRGQSDEACIAAMLDVADSRFQPSLLKQAKDAGKISGDHEIAPERRNNTPERMDLWLGGARRLDLAEGLSLGERVYRLLVLGALTAAAAGHQRDGQARNNDAPVAFERHGQDR